MPELGQKTWGAGWMPDEEQNNARPDCLLQMDNVCLDDRGALTLVRGTSKVNATGFGSLVNKAYSRYINGTQYRYVGYNGTVKRDTAAGDFSAATTILTGGNASRTAFGNALGSVLATSGSVRKKDNGSTVTNLGFAAPAAAPTQTQTNAPYADLLTTPASWTLLEGHNLTHDASTVYFFTDHTSFRAVVQNLYAGAPINYFTLSGGSVGTDTDSFKLGIRITDTSSLVKVRVEILLTTPTGATNDVSDYLYFEWPVNDSPDLNIGKAVWSTLQCTRGDFVRSGSDNTLDWSTVMGIRVIILFNQDDLSINGDAIGAIGLFGGSLGNLTGLYEYVQVNVNNGGSYIAKSGPSVSTGKQYVFAGQNILTPYTTGADAQVTEYWFFRRGETLDQFYYVGKVVVGGAGTVNDNITDQTAIQINITVNFFLDSLQNVSDEILQIEGPVYGRVLYLTYRQIIISDYLNPDFYDTRQPLVTASNVGEQNLFLIQLANSQIILGTTQNLYEINGTLGLLPDGTMDVTIIPLGIEQPPINHAHAIQDNTLFYIASDGLRAVQGATSILISQSHLWLFKGVTRYTVPGVNLAGQGQVGYELAISKNKIWMLVYHTDSSASCFVYDLGQKSWYRWANNPANFFVDEIGTLLAGYSDGYLRILDTGTKYDGSTKITATLLTPYFDGDAPNQRKDIYTFRIWVDTGGDNLAVSLNYDGVSTISLGNINSNGLAEKVVTVNGLAANLKKRFQFSLSGQVAALRITSMTLDFDARPEPLTYKRTTPSNYGVAARKRVTEVPFLIDTYGQNVTATPVFDGTAGTPATVSTNDKRVASILLSAEQYATDIGLLLAATGSNQFEFYELVTPRVVDVLPDTVKYFYISENNLGTPARKRIRIIPLVINTFGANVTYTPILDGVAQTPLTINAARKKTVYYYFVSNKLVIDLSGTLDGGGNPFEYYDYGKIELLETLPAKVEYFYIAEDNLGTPARKRIRILPIVINTFGANVSYTPILDGAAQTPITVNTANKQTVYYYFLADVLAIDVAGTLDGSGNPFEYYGYGKLEQLEPLPAKTEFLYIPETNFGTPARKRLRTLSISINTFGVNVTWIPLVDNTAYPSLVVNTTQKKTVLYYFIAEVLGTDVSGSLNGSGHPFEFYGYDNLKLVEELPVRAEFYKIAETNFGIPTKKRVRTIPIEINTFGQDVIFTPIVDGVSGTPTTFNTSTKRTVFHYFQNDSFGIDYAGTLDGQGNPFEFYEMGQPIDVETLPPPKLFDQIGPLQLDRSASLYKMRVRILTTGVLLNYTIYNNDSSIYSDSIVTSANVDQVYNIRFPKFLAGTVFRIEFSASSVFYRWKVQLSVSQTGMETDSKWVEVK